MNILYVDSEKYGYNEVIVSDSSGEIYRGRAGTIALESDDDYFDVVILNDTYEEIGKVRALFRYPILMLMFLLGFENASHTLGGPNYYKIRIKNQLFMQLQYDRIYTNSFKSNAKIQIEKIKNKTYNKYWIISYIIPTQLIFLLLVLIGITCRNIPVAMILILIIAGYMEYCVLSNIYRELKK